jgi:hypothetical protein
MKRYLFHLLLFTSLALSAQNDFTKYNWNSMLTPKGGDTIKAVNGAVILLERRITEVYLNKENFFEETFIFHRKIRVESHEAVNQFNKIYISLNNVIDIIDVAARFISPSGKETIISKNEIKQIENLENKGSFKTFVIEGAETGGQIEYYYVLHKKFNPFGGFYVQDETPRANVEAIFVYPQKLSYMFRCNNGFPAFVADESKENKTDENKNDDIKITQRASIKYVSGISKEKYAYYEPNLMSYDFTLAYNNFNSSLRVYSWSKACDRYYNDSYIFTKEENSSVNKLLKKIALTATDSEAKIRQIENWVKQNFKVDKDLEDQLSLTTNINLKQCNFSAISKLYIGLFQAAGINFEFIKTGDVSIQPFRRDFDAYNYLDYTLIYFPEINKYLTPEDNDYRLGIIPAELQGGYGLFMKPLVYNESIKTLGYEIRQIPKELGVNNSDSLDIKVSIDVDAKLLKTNNRRVMNGDFARSFQSFIHLLDDNKKKELVESVFSMGKDKTEVLSSKIENSRPEDIGVKPMIWDLELQTKSLIEEAGEDLLIKIGETIGQQSELYQENQRVLPITIGILHDYYRIIKFTIPKGYKVDNLKDLNMHVEMKTNGKTGCIFTSEASLKDNIITIESKEYYLESSYPASRYDEFRKVINAAADFNKKILLLRKN